MLWKWFKENVLGELPIIGGFFKGKDIYEALHHAGKMTCELAGGSTCMIVFMLNKQMQTHDMNMRGMPTTEDAIAYYAEMTGSMALGMMAGGIVFNTLYSAGKGTYHFFKCGESEHHLINDATEDEVSLLEKSPLLPNYT